MSVGCVAFSVTVKVPLLFVAKAKTAGSSRTTVGDAMVTIMWVWTVLPFRVAVSVAVPVFTPATATVWDRWPAGMVTAPSGGTATMAALLEVRLTTVSVSGTALRVTMSGPDAPWRTANVVGRRLVSVTPARTVTVL